MSSDQSSWKAKLASAVPDPIFYRLIAGWFRAQSEQRLLLLDELVPAHRNAVDVGVWWGPWTYWLSRRCPAVHSFEPNPEIVPFLERVVASNVQLQAVGLSDAAGEADLFASGERGMDALATLSASQKVEGSSAVSVPLRTLDSFALHDVGFMKIDVEGHEFEMLEGAQETLTGSQPTVLLELEQRFHPDRPIADMFDFFADLAFSGWFRRDKAWKPLTDFDLERDQTAHENDPTSLDYVNNFVFRPTAAGAPGSA